MPKKKTTKEKTTRREQIRALLADKADDLFEKKPRGGMIASELEKLSEEIDRL